MQTTGMPQEGHARSTPEAQQQNPLHFILSLSLSLPIPFFLSRIHTQVSFPLFLFQLHKRASQDTKKTTCRQDTSKACWACPMLFATTLRVPSQVNSERKTRGTYDSAPPPPYTERVDEESGQIFFYVSSPFFSYFFFTQTLFFVWNQGQIVLSGR